MAFIRGRDSWQRFVAVSCDSALRRYPVAVLPEGTHVTVPRVGTSCSIAQPLLRYVSHVSFPGVRTKTFSTHITTQIAPDVRETGLFTHGRASLNFTIIPMRTPDVAMPCPCCAWQGCAMPPHLRTIGSSRARTLVVPCVLTPQLPPFAIAHLTPYSLTILSLLACHHSPAALSIPLSSPHRPSPILSMFPSPTCVLKRFRSRHRVNCP